MKQLPLFDGVPPLDPGQDRKQAQKGAGDEQNAGTDWYMPPEIVVATVELMGAIDLDPRSNSKKMPNVPAKQYFSAEDGGLTRPWGPKRRVFLNPPGTRTTGAWVNKVCNEYEAGNISEAVVLVHADVDSDWWQRLTAYPVCFVFRKLRFGGKQRGAPHALAVAYLGANLTGFADAFSDIGTIYVPFRRPAAPAVPSARQHGRYILTVHFNASYLTIANPTWDARNPSQDQEWLRESILALPGILPSRYSAVSKTAEGTAKLVFSFKKVEADEVVRQVEAILDSPRPKPKKADKQSERPAQTPAPTKQRDNRGKRPAAGPSRLKPR